MIGLILGLLIILFIFGFIDIPSIPLRDTSLFNLFGQVITLYDLLLFALILWIIEVLPWPFRSIAMVLLLLWLLTFFGIIAIAGFSNIIVLAFILGLVVYIFQGMRFK